MNTLDTSKNGGHPLYMEDMGFIQNTYKEAFEGVTSALGADSYILSGCVKTLQSAGVWAISAGFVVLDGEVFKVAAHTVSFTNENNPLYFKIVQSYVEPSPVIYKESGMQNVHTQRRAVVSTEATDWGYGLSKYSKLLTALQDTPTFEIPPEAGFEGMFYGRVRGGFFYLYGRCESTTSNPFDYFFLKIPPKYTPLIFTSEVSFSEIPQFYWTEQHLLNAILGRIRGVNSSDDEVADYIGEISNFNPVSHPPLRSLDFQARKHFTTSNSVVKIEITIPMGMVMWPIKL